MTTAKPRPLLAPGEIRTYPVLPLRDTVVFPHVIAPLLRRTQEVDPRARGGDAVQHLHPARHSEERVRRRSGNGGDLRNRTAAFAKRAVEQNKFQRGSREPYDRIMGWLLSRVGRS